MDDIANNCITTTLTDEDKQYIIKSVFRDKYLLRLILNQVPIIHHRLQLKTFKYRLLQSEWIAINKYYGVLSDKLQHDPLFTFDEMSLRYFCFANDKLDLLIKLIQKYPNLLVNQRGSKTTSSISLFNRPSFYMLDDCCIAGHIDIIKYLTEQGYRASSDAINNCAKYGHLDLLNYLDQNRTEGCSKIAMDVAAENGKFDTVKYLHKFRKEGCTKRALDMAASNGHIDIVKFLHENHKICSKAAMDGAAAGGYLDIVKFLHEQRKEGCSKAALDGAAAGGYLDIVKFLHSSRSEGCTTLACDSAAGGGHFEVLQFLHLNRTEGATIKAMEDAAEGGHLKCVKYLHEQMALHCTLDALDNAIGGGHLDVVMYLANISGGMRPSGRGIDLCCKSGYIDMIEYISIRYQRIPLSDDSFFYSVAFNHFEILDFIYKRIDYQEFYNTKKYQSTYGYLSIPDILKAHQTHLQQLELERKEHQQRLFSNKYVNKEFKKQQEDQLNIH